MMICEGCKGFLYDQYCTRRRPPDIVIPHHLGKYEKLTYWLVPWHHGCYNVACKLYKEGKDYQEYFLERRRQRDKERHPILWKIKSLLRINK